MLFDNKPLSLWAFRITAIMKSLLKPVVLTIISTLTVFCAVYVTSCKPDNCKAIACAYGGSCVNGVCTCKPGYEGANCETISRDKFLGKWEVNETGSVTPNREYGLAIVKDTDVTKVIIKNLYNFFNDVTLYATITGDTMTIYNQQLDAKVVFGKGYIMTSPGSPTINNQVVMRYEVVDTFRVVDDFGVYPVIDHSNPSIWTR